MFKKMKVLLEILQNQNEIKKLLDPTVIAKAKKYDELRKTLRDVVIPTKKITVAVGPNGIPQVTILYEQITEVVDVYSDGKTESSGRFKAMNLLDLVPYADMRKISAAIDEAKKK